MDQSVYEFSAYVFFPNFHENIIFGKRCFQQVALYDPPPIPFVWILRFLCTDLVWDGKYEMIRDLVSLIITFDVAKTYDYSY